MTVKSNEHSMYNACEIEAKRIEHGSTGYASEARSTQNWVRTKITAFVAIHVIVGIVAALCSADQPAVSSAILLSVVFCQTSLVGVWGGFGKSHWLLRLIGVICGTVYLAVELGLGIGELEAAIVLLVVVATSVVTATTWVVRQVKAYVGHLEVARTDVGEGLQFSIQHLMLLTFVIACLVTVGKLLAPYLNGANETTAILTLGLCYDAVALTTIWAMLGLGNPLLRVPFVFIIAGSAGWLGAYVIDNQDHIFWISTTILQALLLVLSFLIMRVSGYRLMEKLKT